MSPADLPGRPQSSGVETAFELIELLDERAGQALAEAGEVIPDEAHLAALATDIPCSLNAWPMSCLACGRAFASAVR